MNGGREDPSLLDADGEREEEEVSNKAARLAARTRTQMGKREVEGGGQRQEPIRYEMDVNVRFVEGYFSGISGRAQHSFMATTITRKG